MRKLLNGKVVSDKAEQTAVVEVVSWKTHRIFKKRYKRSRRFLVHNPEDKYKVGENVIIGSTKPLSKNKHFQIESLASEAKEIVKKEAKKVKAV